MTKGLQTEFTRRKGLSFPASFVPFVDPFLHSTQGDIREMGKIEEATTSTGAGFIKISRWEKSETEGIGYDYSPDGLIYSADNCRCPFCGEHSLHVQASHEDQNGEAAPLIRYWSCDSCDAGGEYALFTVGIGDVGWPEADTSFDLFPEAFVSYNIRALK